jgi:hypothetical protein
VRALLNALALEDVDEIVIDTPPPNPKLEEALNEPFAPGFVNVPLQDALRAISEKFPAPIRMTADAEARCPVDSPCRINLELPARPRRVVMQLALDQVADNLTFSVLGHSIVVTTLEESTEVRSLRLYDIQDAESHGRVPEFIQAVLRSTSGPWEYDEPGTGVLSIAGPGRLLVWQTGPTHRQLRELIQSHRPFWQRDSGSPKRMETRVYWIRSDLAEPVATLIRETVSPAYWNDPRHGGIVRTVVPGAVGVAPAGAAPAAGAPAGNGPPLWRPNQLWFSPTEPLSLGRLDSYRTLPGIPEYGAAARVDLRGDPSKESHVLIIRAPFELHRQIDQRIDEFLTVNSTFRLVGLPPQLGFLVPDINLPAAENAVSTDP